MQAPCFFGQSNGRTSLNFEPQLRVADACFLPLHWHDSADRFINLGLRDVQPEALRQGRFTYHPNGAEGHGPRCRHRVKQDPKA
jgi:hypothetical protein